MGTLKVNGNIEASSMLKLNGDWENDFGILLQEGGGDAYGGFIKYGSNDYLTIGTRENSTDVVALKIVRGSANITALGSITATSFIGNASSASKWATARTIKIGKTGKSVDGSSDVSWTHYEIGVPYCYDTSPTGSPAYSHWGMLISREENKYGQSGTGDNYFIGVNSNSQLHIGHQLNGTSIITWTNILSEHNYSSYALPLSGGTLTGHLTISNGQDLYLKALSGSSDSGDIVFANGSGDETGRIWISGGLGWIRFSGSDSQKYLIHSENIGSQSVNYANSAGYASSLYQSANGHLTWGGDHSLTCNDRPSARLHFGYSDLYFLGDSYHILLHAGNYASYCAPASHSHNYVTPGAPNNLMHSGNEFTFVPAGYSGGVWFNYRTAGWETNGNISQYTFGNGRGGAAPIEHLYDITHNYGAYDPNTQSPPGTGVIGAIFYRI